MEQVHTLFDDVYIPHSLFALSKARQTLRLWISVDGGSEFCCCKLCMLASLLPSSLSIYPLLTEVDTRPVIS